MPISDSSIPLFSAIIPIVFICALEVLLSALKNKSRSVKHVLEGEPTYIIYKGRILSDALEENRLSVNEVLAEMRSQGIGNIEDAYYAILEPNGKLSVLEKGGGRQMGHAVIIDGEIKYKELGAAEKDEAWLYKKLSERNVEIKDVLIASVLDNGEIKIMRRETKK